MFNWLSSQWRKAMSLYARYATSFSGRAGIVLTGSVFGQGLAFALLPVVTRIYQVDVIGRAAPTLAILSTLSLLAMMQYDQAIIVCDDEDLPALTQLALLIIGIWLTVITIVIYFARFVVPEQAGLLDTYGINVYLLLLFLSYPLFLLLLNLHLRENNLVKVSIGRFLYYGGTPLFQILFGLLFSRSQSMFLVAQATAAAIATLYFLPSKRFITWMMETSHFSTAAINNMKRVAWKYSDFPKYQAGAQSINNFSNQAPIFILRAAFSEKWAGWYYIAYRMLAAPTALLSQAIGQVFYRDSAERERDGSFQAKTLERIVTGLIKVSLLPGVALGLVIPYIVEFVLGSSWRPAGTMIQILLISFIVSFVISPISLMLNVKNRQSAAFYSYTILAVTRFVLCGLAAYLGSAWGVIWGYAVASTIVLIPLLQFILKISGTQLAPIIYGIRYLFFEAAIIILCGLLSYWQFPMVVNIVFVVILVLVLIYREIVWLRRTEQSAY